MLNLLKTLARVLIVLVGVESAVLYFGKSVLG